jgi:hypothetical protein
MDKERREALDLTITTVLYLVCAVVGVRYGTPGAQTIGWWMLYLAGGFVGLWVLLIVGTIGYYYFFKPEEFWIWDKTKQQWRNRRGQVGS